MKVALAFYGARDVATLDFAIGKTTWILNKKKIDFEFDNNLCIILQIDRISTEQITAAFEEVGGEIGWQLFAEEGDMKMYRR